MHGTHDDIETRIRRADPATAIGDHDEALAAAAWRQTPGPLVTRRPRRRTLAIAGGIVALGTAAAAIAPTLVSTVWGDAGYVEVMPFELDGGAGSCSIAVFVLEAASDGEILDESPGLPGGVDEDADITFSGTWEGFLVDEDESAYSHDEFVEAAEYVMGEDWQSTMTDALATAVADEVRAEDNLSPYSDETWRALLQADAASMALLGAIDAAMDAEGLNADGSAVLHYSFGCDVADEG